MPARALIEAKNQTPYWETEFRVLGLDILRKNSQPLRPPIVRSIDFATIFRILMRSGNTPGQLTFATDPVEDQYQFGTLIYLSNEIVPVSQIEFLSGNLSVVPEPISCRVLFGLSMVLFARLRNLALGI